MRPAYLPLTAPITNYAPPTPPELGAYDVVFFDTETTGLNWAKDDRPVGISVGTPDGQNWYLPFGHKPGGNLDEALVRRWAQRELRGKHLVNLNTRFDVHMLRVWGVDLRQQGNTFHDVAHAEALLDAHAHGFSLEAIARRRLKTGKIDVGDKSNIAWQHASNVAAYAELDTDLPRRIMDAHRPLLAELGLQKVKALEDRVIPVVVEMEANGLPIDVPTLERWEKTSRKILDKMLWELYREVGFGVNPKSPTDMTRLFLSLGLPLTRLASGRASFTAEVLEEHEHHPTIQKIQRIGKLRDLRTKSMSYLENVVGGKLCPSFHQMKNDDNGAVTGRFSSSNPNGQNVHKPESYEENYAWLREYTDGEDYAIRRLFRPEHGVWLCADAEQIEFRLTAHDARGPAMLAAYDADPLLNYHKHVMGMLVKHNPDISYSVAKIANFLTIYGGQAPALAKKAKITKEAAEAFRAVYFRALPEIKELMDRCTGLAETRGYIKSLEGRRLTFPYVEKTAKDGRTFTVRANTHAALNYRIQPSAADVNKRILADVYDARHDLGITMRATVHDEIDGDVPHESYVPRIKAFLNEQRYPLRVPILWSVGTGETWAAAK